MRQVKWCQWPASNFDDETLQIEGRLISPTAPDTSSASWCESLPAALRSTAKPQSIRCGPPACGMRKTQREISEISSKTTVPLTSSPHR